MSLDREKLHNIRRRRGLSQRELAEISGVSIQTIRQIEQGERTSVRLETLRNLAKALKVRTTMLRVGRDTSASAPDPETTDLWGPVRRALAGQLDEPEEPASNAGVRESFDAIQPLLEAHRYGDISALLPSLLRDADSLDDREGRTIRAAVLSMTGWLLCQNRQFDTAVHTLDRAITSATDPVAAGPAVNALVWTYLRQGDLDKARSLAGQWAYDYEPRFSRATVGQLALWGRLHMYLANAAVRDNSPAEVEDALSNARAAAEKIGHEIMYDPHPARTFGPVTVAHTAAECAVIGDRPDKALAISEGLPTEVVARDAASRLRHRLDVANAHMLLRDYGSAMDVLLDLRQLAPEWLAQQKYARDVVGGIIAKRRTLTPEMRDIADLTKVEY